MKERHRCGLYLSEMYFDEGIIPGLETFRSISSYPLLQSSSTSESAVSSWWIRWSYFIEHRNVKKD